MKNLPDGYIRVDGTTYFDEAIRNYLSFKNLAPMILNDAQERFIDKHIDDRNIFGFKKFRSRQVCRDYLHRIARQQWLSIEILLETIGYLPETFTEYNDPFSEPCIIYGAQMEHALSMRGTEECYVSTKLMDAVEFWGQDKAHDDMDALWIELNYK